MREIGAEQLEVLTSGAQLAECPIWDVERGVLWWVDITGGTVHRLDTVGDDAVALQADGPTGSIALAADGTPIVAVGQALGILDCDGTWEPLASVGEIVPGGVLNDCGCDPDGRLWIGVSTTAERDPIGCLRRIEPTLAISTALTELTIPNGLDWSPDGATMYFVDSPSRQVRAYPFRDGRLGSPRVLANTEPADGLPDGLTVDAEGAIWVAYWGGGCVRRFLPDGRLDVVVRIPAPLVTSCGFGGPGLDELFITTAAEPTDTPRSPSAGAVLRVRPGESGLPPRRFAWHRR